MRTRASNSKAKAAGSPELEQDCSRCRKERCSWIFSGVSEEEFRRFTRLVKHVHYEEDETIFQEGALAFGVYIVCRGKVKLVGRSPSGKRRILKLLGPGEVLGEESLFADGIYTSYARTLEPSLLGFVSRESFLELVKSSPALSLKLLEKLARELGAFQSKLVEAAYQSGERRLARLLLAIGERFGRRVTATAATTATAVEAEVKDAPAPDSPRLELELELSRSELAELVGLAPETTIRTLSRLQERGLLELEGTKITISDPKGLGELADRLPITPPECII